VDLVLRAIALRPTRLLALGGILLLGLLYWKPLHTYMSTRQELQARRADVRALRAEKSELDRRIAQAGTSTALVREARLLGYVKPGERLFIVRGISAWRQHQK
jgi:cell division protein FtsB